MSEKTTVIEHGELAARLNENGIQASVDGNVITKLPTKRVMGKVRFVKGAKA